MKYIIAILLLSISLYAKEGDIYTKFIWSGNERSLEKRVNEELFLLQLGNKKIKEIKMSCTMSGGLVLIIYESNKEE